MCGICGIWYFEKSRSVEAALIRRMTDQISHRGPDEAGSQLMGAVGLGFRRLSIIDVAGSHQPMHNEDGCVWIVFNGEIYNFQSLRSRLVENHQFYTNGDTETIVHAYEEFGVDCVKQLRGMFAFAIWDARENRLMLAVDRFGKKPIYTYLDNEKLIFASELKCILEHPNISRELDREALDEYLAYGYITAPRSIFKSIRKLPPGYTMTINADGQATLQEYWHPTLLPPDQWDWRPLEDQAAELREILKEAVRLRMISDVPLGAFLSGGVDSSAVVALMSQVSTQPVRTFSIGFDESVYDETAYAQIVADYCHTDHVREVVRPDVVAILPKIIHQLDEPFADSSVIPTYYVSQAARQHVTVALSGDGGDEVFGGYHRYLYAYRHQLLRRYIPHPLRSPAESMGRVMPKFTKLRPYLSVVKESTDRWHDLGGFFTADRRAELYTPDALHQLGDYQTEQVKQVILQQGHELDWLGRIQYGDVRGYMPGDILVKVDRASMLASLEVRSPLLDHEVFEFMARVPSHYKLAWGGTKIILKKALGNLLPPQIHQRGKKGFEIPLKEWLAGPLNGLMRDTLTSERARHRGLFNPVVVSRLIGEHTNGTGDHRERLWALLCFELWAQEYAA